jgi:p-hydroxybenzoate 3-monooxygenase
MPERTDVAIVGAGPAGLVLVHLLGQAGIPFIVAERQTYPDLGRRPKAGLIEYRTVQQLGAVRIAGTVLDFTARNHQCDFRTPAGSAVLDYGALAGGRPHYLYPQHQLIRRPGLVRAHGPPGQRRAGRGGAGGHRAGRPPVGDPLPGRGRL